MTEAFPIIRGSFFNLREYFCNIGKWLVSTKISLPGSTPQPSKCRVMAPAGKRRLKAKG
jgi:hypothetical protein